MTATFDRLAAALADRYKIERELGQGGMATVYLAEDVKHKRKVALKVLKPELAAVLGAERFIQEITTTAALQHPHILPLFDSGTAEGFLYYVMPFIDGETLRAKLDRETQLGIDEAVRIAVAVADALDYAHRHGVIHRDIKPENILLHDGRPMVADFGIALALSAAAGGRMTETGMSLGTPHYMSPEQATAEKEITARSDVYSLGSVLYEMLTGNPPHTGPSAQQIIMKIVTEEAAPVTRMRKAVPPNVAAAVARSLEKLPADRFESAKAFGDALENRGFTVAGTALNGAAAAARLRNRLNPVLAGAAFVALVLAAWGWMRRTPASTLPDSWRLAVTLPDSAQITGPPSLSADGTMLAYVAGDTKVWLLRNDGEPPVPIPGTEGTYEAALSPGGTHLALLRAGALEVLPLTGGTGTRVADTTDLSIPPAWIGNESLVVSQLAGLVRFSVSGGKRSVLTRVDPDSSAFWHVWPVALPDGRGVLFVQGRADLRDLSQWQVAVVGLDGGEPKVITPGIRAAYAEPGYLIVTRANGTIVAVPFDLESLRVTGEEVPLVAGLHLGGVSVNGCVSVSATGRLVYLTGQDWSGTDLVRVRRNGSVVPVDTTRSGEFSSVALSPDARWASLTVSAGGPEELRFRNLVTGALIRVMIPGQFLRNPVFTPGGDTVFFAGLSLRKMRIYRATTGGTEAPQEVIVLGEGELPAPVGVSPSGLLYYLARRGVARSLLTHDLRAPDAPDRLVLPPEIQVFDASLAPDGRWLAYVSNESNRTELFVRPTDPTRAERWQIPRPSATGVGAPSEAHWSRDGRELVYRSGDVLVSARVAAGAAFVVTDQRVLLDVKRYAESFDLLPNGDFLMIHKRPGAGSVKLMMMDRWGSGIR